MKAVRFFKNLPINYTWIRNVAPFQKWKALMLLPLLALLMSLTSQKNAEVLSPEKINLALRRTADGLLRASGDSTSRIPAVEQTGPGVWQVRLDQPFLYDQLPGLLQSSLDVYGIKQPYEVAVRQCTNDIIDLGYQKADVLPNKEVPCAGRDMPEGCHYIEITFLDKAITKPFWTRNGWILLLVLGGPAVFWFFYRSKLIPVSPDSDNQKDWLEFANSRLDVAGQVLISGGVQKALTFRETKLLRLFVTSPDRLLERDFILRQVWEDEGIFVGRSVDVFVSRLRKKLATDPSVGIVAVHGVGYRLETGKMG